LGDLDLDRDDRPALPRELRADDEGFLAARVRLSRSRSSPFGPAIIEKSRSSEKR